MHHTRTHSLTHAHTQSHSPIHTPTHTPTQTHSSTRTHPHILSYSLTHSPTHSPTHSLAYTQTLTHTLTHRLACDVSSERICTLLVNVKESFPTQSRQHTPNANAHARCWPATPSDISRTRIQIKLSTARCMTMAAPPLGCSAYTARLPSVREHSLNNVPSQRYEP